VNDADTSAADTPVVRDSAVRTPVPCPPQTPFVPPGLNNSTHSFLLPPKTAWSLEEWQILHKAYNSSVRNYSGIEQVAWRLGLKRSKQKIMEWINNKRKKFKKLASPLPKNIEWGLEVFLDGIPTVKERKRPASC
jgi:hypothetical protein